MKNEFSIASLSGLQLVGMFSALSPGREHTRPSSMVANQLIVTLNPERSDNERKIITNLKLVLGPLPFSLFWNFICDRPKGGKFRERKEEPQNVSKICNFPFLGYQVNNVWIPKEKRKRKVRNPNNLITKDYKSFQRRSTNLPWTFP